MKYLSAIETIEFNGFIIDNFYVLNELPNLFEIQLMLRDCFIPPDNDTKNIKDSIYIRRDFTPDR
jgi:hypothetical protein